MGYIGGIRKRKKTEEKVEQNNSLVKQPNNTLDWWDEFSQRLCGSLSEYKNSARFESLFRMSRKTFDYICSLVKEEMMTKLPNFSDISGRPLSSNDRVAVALWKLSSGESLIRIGDSFGINPSTISYLTWRFVECMEEKGLHHLQWPSIETKMEEVKSKFERIRGLPNCCGAIGTTHFEMTLPAVERAVWLDYENNCSVTLQAVVDPDMRFLNITAGWPGSLNESTVLKSSGLFKCSEGGTRLNGEKIKLSQGVELGEYIVGDKGFPLLPWLLTPYHGKGLSELQTEFNKHHYATRLVAKQALARLKNMWKIIEGVMWKPDKNKLPRLILVCCLLHNILIDLDDDIQDQMPVSHVHDKGYRQQFCESFDETASCVRDTLSLHLYGKLTPAKKLSPVSSRIGNPCS